MLPKLLAGALLIVVLAAVSTVGAVYFLDYSEPAAETIPCTLHPAPAMDAPPCCDVSADLSLPPAPAKCSSKAVDAK